MNTMPKGMSSVTKRVSRLVGPDGPYTAYLDGQQLDLASSTPQDVEMGHG